MNNGSFGFWEGFWLLTGIVGLIVWLRKTGMGRTALDDAPLDSMPARLWSLLGMGGSFKRMARGFPFYCLILFSLTFGVLAITVVTCRLFGYDQIQRHATLQKLQHAELGRKVLLCFKAAVLSPVVEELFYRGFCYNAVLFIAHTLYLLYAAPSSLSPLQALSGGCRPMVGLRWLAMVCTSLFFVCGHQDMQHWPALFVLAMGLGYAYEKHGNLLLPVAIHAVFNSLVLAVNLLWPTAA